MKVVAFNGSPRKDGNTAQLLKYVLNRLDELGVNCELVNLSGNVIRGCIACQKCKENLNRRCAIDTDIVNECISKMIEADGIVIGSPTYYTNVSAEIKALIDRVGMVAWNNRESGNDGFLRRKVGAAVVAVRRVGAINTFNAINSLYLIHEMIVPGSIYWNVGVGCDPGDVTSDEEGIRTMIQLADNMTWLMKKISTNNS